jgi:hypothetical protein
MAEHDNDWLDDVDAAPAVHTVEAVSQSDEFVEWGCSTCGRLVRVTRSGGLTVLHRGDTMRACGVPQLGWPCCQRC